VSAAIADALREKARELLALADALDAETAPPAPSSPSGVLLTTGELAAALKLSRDTIDRRAKDGSIPFLRVSSRRRFSLADVIGALAKSESKPANDGAGVVRLARRSRG
jgi:excisionase family DNA binding protein